MPVFIFCYKFQVGIYVSAEKQKSKSRHADLLSRVDPGPSSIANSTTNINLLNMYTCIKGL